MQKVTHNQQSGAVSMVTVIFLALLLSIITVSFIRLSITEQRQAIDDDLSSRAFYAAESGVEDAKRALELRLSNQMTDEELNASTCEPANNSALGITLDINNYAVLSSDLATAYTCQMINLHPPDFQAELNEWDSITVPLDSGGLAYDKVEIEWHNDDDGAANVNANPAQLKTKLDWSTAGHPAMLRARIFSTPAGNFSRSQITSNVAFLNPGNLAADPTYTYLTSFDGAVRNASCDNTGYKCKVTINGLNSGNKNYLRLMSIYRGTHIKISLVEDSTGSTVNIQSVQAIVDVTGKAGDVYRRIEARVSLLDNKYPLPDFALWSNDEICKNFTITNNLAGFSYPTSEPSKCQWLP